MDTPKNILNSSNHISLQSPPDETQGLDTPKSTYSQCGDSQQSFQLKKEVLFQALSAKKKANMKEYYSIINKQGFVNAKEEPLALRIWLKVILDTISMLIHEYQDFELLDLLVFKLPWFIPTTTHGQNFQCFMRLALAIFPHDVSYIHKVIKHIFSPHGLFQCIMIGEHRPSLSELMWDAARSALIHNESTHGHTLTEEHRQQIHDDIKTIKTHEDVSNRAKLILNKYSDLQSIRKVTDIKDQIFLKTLFSFHQTKELPTDKSYPILVGNCHNQPAFMVQQFVLSEGALPDEDDAISIKKCLKGLLQGYSKRVTEFAEQKFKSSPLSKLSLFLNKTMSVYPFSQATILQSLLEKLPHKSMPVENQYIYNKLALEIAKACPEIEEKILETITERLCQIDVDIRVRPRRFEFSKDKKIQTYQSYVKELHTKIQDEKEMKLDILFNQLLEYIDERIKQQSKDLKEEDFTDTIMKVFENKIFPTHKLNFIQYIPLYLMSLHTKNEKCYKFTEKLLSFLIIKSFNCLQKEHLSVRQQAWNYLSSLLSREHNLINETTQIKCLHFIMRYFEQFCKSKKSTRASSLNSCSSSAQEPILENQTIDKLAGQDRIFQHSFIQGLVLILNNKIDLLKTNDPELFTKICKLIFKKCSQSLLYSSPLVLHDLLTLAQSNKFGLGVFKDKVQHIFNIQAEELKTSKRQVYSKVSRFLPYDTPIYLYSVGDKIKNHITHLDININQEDELLSQQENQDQVESIQHHSSQEEEKALPPQPANNAVLFIPDDSIERQEEKIASISQIIAWQRKNDKSFSKQNFQEDAEMTSLEISNKLNERNLLFSLEDRQREFSEDCEAISSSRETEYSVSSPYPMNQQLAMASGYTSQKTLGSMGSPVDGVNNLNVHTLDIQTIKSRQRKNIRKQVRNLTMTLREQNNKADGFDQMSKFSIVPRRQ